MTAVARGIGAYLPGSGKPLGAPVGVVSPDSDGPISSCHHEQPSLHQKQIPQSVLTMDLVSVTHKQWH